MSLSSELRARRVAAGGLLILVLALVAKPALAQDAGGANVGIAYGLSVPDADSTNPRHLAGITGAARIGPTFSFGGYYFVSGTEEGSGGRDFKYGLHGLKAVYHAGGGQGETYFGIMAGMTKVKTVQNNVELIFSPYHYGIVAGHDYGILGWLMIGFEGFFVKAQDSTTMESGTVYREDSFNLIGFLATMKLRF